jgi:integrase
LEDGLRPVSAGDRDAILRFAKKAASRELSLMLTLGFFTGTRVGTIADLKIETLERAAPDPASPNLFRLAVGPRAKPPVHTKFGVTGHILMVRAQLDELRQYAVSRRRILREALAAPENKNLLFLTRSGNPYAQRGSDRSPAINVEMHTLRRKGEAREVIALRDFYFHCSRCTFATELARAAIAIGGSIDAIAIVQEALLHQNEATSLRYIRFVEKTAIRAQVASEYSELFLGIARAYQATERSEGDD